MKQTRKPDSSSAQGGDLIAAASMAIAQGRHGEAAMLWRQAVAQSRSNGDALVNLGTAALQAKRFDDALRCFALAAELFPDAPLLHLYVALCHRGTGDRVAENAAIDQALVIDPYFFPAMLHRATMLERQGKMRQAARLFATVLKIVGDPTQVAREFAGMVQYAQRAVARNQAELGQQLQSVVPTDGEAASWEAGRLRKAAAVMAGGKKVFHPDPVRFCYPELPSIQFYDDCLFPWLKTLEAATPLILRELMNLLEQGCPGFAPYIQIRADKPANQWAELNHSPRWSSYFLWLDGQKQEENCARCPETVKVLESLPMADIRGLAPNVMFSCLDPHTVIPPHTGETNVRLVTHLALIVPEGCAFRVGNETRQWHEGKAFVFDDSVEHEARNDSDEPRAVLIFDTWNPFLTAPERAAIPDLFAAVADYYHAEDDDADRV